MAFRKKLLVAAVGSALGATSFGALAAAPFNMDDSNVSAVKFAEEVKADDSTPATIPFGGTDLTAIKSKLGWGFNKGEVMYIRLDLTMGGSSGKVVFKADPRLDVSAGVDGSFDTSDTGLNDGGSGETYIIYKVTSASASSPTDEVEFSFGPVSGLEAKSVSSDIELTYSISTNEDLTPNTALYSKTVSLIEFAPSFKFESDAEIEATADVNSNFVKFTGEQSTAAIARFKFASTGDTYVFENLNSATISTIGAIFSSDTSLEVVGDFTLTEDSPGTGVFTNASARVFITGNTDGCSSKISADSVAADKAVFENFTVDPSDTGNSNVYVCVTGNGSEIIESTYSLNLLGKGNTTDADDDGNDYALDDSTLADIGKIVQNGTKLITPYITITDGYISRVMLSNTGAQDIDYSANIITDDGNSATVAAGATGTVKAGTNLHIDAADSGKGRPYLVDGFATKQRGAVLFTFVGANTDIQGVYQTINVATGEIQSIIMQRPGGGDGELD